MATPTEDETGRVDAVVDSNVLLDVYSCHDVVESYNDAYERSGNAAIDHPSVVFRRARARESLLLAIYFGKIGATTHSLHNEAIDRLITRAPPAPGGQSMTSDFATTFVHFVKDYVLGGWTPELVTPKLAWENAPVAIRLRVTQKTAGPVGNNADAWHIAHAKERRLVLITNEGFSPTGYAQGKIAKRAAAEGVQTAFPHEFYRGKINDAEEIEAFLLSFRQEATRYLDARDSNDAMGEVLRWVYGYFRLVLLGEAEGRVDPVRVSIAPR